MHPDRKNRLDKKAPFDNKPPFHKKALAASVLAAVSSAVLALALWFSFVNMQLFVFLFGFFVSLPILVVAFGYGISIGIASAILATFFLLFSLPPGVALLLALFFFVPSVFAGWLTGLTQTTGATLATGSITADGGRNGTVALCPLPLLLFQMILAIIIVTIAIMLYLLSSADVVQYFNLFLDHFVAAVNESNLYPAEDQPLIEAAIRARFIPGIASVFAVYGFLFHLGNLYFSMRLAKSLGYLRRPLENWPAALRMPPTALFMFGIGSLVLLFSSNDTLVICANAIVSALGVGFFASGLAVIHHVMRGRPWRIAALSLLYIGLFTLVLMPFIVMVLIITGLIATFFLLRRNGKIQHPENNNFN